MPMARTFETKDIRIDSAVFPPTNLEKHGHQGQQSQSQLKLVQPKVVQSRLVQPQGTAKISKPLYLLL